MQTTQAAPPALAVQTKKLILVDMLNSSPGPPMAASAGSSFILNQQHPMGYGVGVGGHRQTPSFSSTPVTQVQTTFGGGAAALRPTSMAMVSAPTAPTNKTSAAPTTKNSSNFDDLWSLSLGSTSAKPPASGASGKSIKDLEKEKVMAGLWGGGQQQRPQVATPTMTPQPSAFGSTNGGVDDLLL